MTETSFTKTYKFSIYALITFFVFYFVQALYYRYFFYWLGGAGDWAIYSQALQLIQWSDINPYLSIRGIRIFNDHFDPIIIPFALTFAKVFPPALVMVTVEIFSISASAWVIYWYAKKKDYSPSATILMVMYILFNKGTFTGIFSPSHPTTWSTFALVVFGIAWMEGKFKWVLASLVFLYTFKEEFPLVGFMVTLVYAYKKEWRKAIITFIVSFAWFWFTQHRSLFFEGWHMNYSSGVIYSMLHPLNLFNEGFTKIFFKTTNLIISLVLLSIPILYLKIKETSFKWNNTSLELTFFSIPLFVVRSTFSGFMTYMTAQYLSQLTTLWGLALFNVIKKIHFSKKFILAYLLILFIFINFSYEWGGFKSFIFFKRWYVGTYINMIKDTLEGKENEDIKRKRELDKTVTYFDKMGDTVNIFTHDALDIHFIKNRYVYDSAMEKLENKNVNEVYLDRDEPLRPRPENDNYLVLEKKDFDSNNPFIKNFMKNAEVVMDNEYVVIAKKKAQN